MENQERKILVEVSPEEYEKIKAGALDKEIPTYESVRKDVLEKMSDEDVKILVSNHYGLIADNIDDETLIAQIIRRSQTKSQPEFFREPVSLEDCTFGSGELRITKKDYSQIGEPLFLSKDTFNWRLKSFDERTPR